MQKHEFGGACAGGELQDGVSMPKMYGSSPMPQAAPRYGGAEAPRFPQGAPFPRSAAVGRRGWSFPAPAEVTCLEPPPLPG